MTNDDQKAIRRIVVGVAKVAAWERAKGELRAMVEIEGQHPPEYNLKGQPEQSKFPALLTRVEDFINNIENDGLHE